MIRILLLVFCALPVLMPCGVNAQTVNIETGLLHEFNVFPGGQYDGTITVANVSDKPASIVIYKNDSFRPEPGDIYFAEPGERSHERSNVDWITITEPVVQLQPFERKDVRFIIKVPSEERLAHLNGTYWSSLMIESLESKRRRQRPAVGNPSRRFDMAMTSSYRTGVLITTNFAAQGSSAITFMDVKTRPEPDGGAHTLMVDVRNDSPAALKPKRIWVELYDQNGTKRADLDLDELKIMLPGNAYRRHIQLSSEQVQPGSYRCVVVLDVGDEKMFGTQANLKIASTRM